MRQLLSLISHGLGLKTDTLERSLGDKPRLVSQANYYPPCPQPELTLGLPPNTDINALTILMQSEDMTGPQVIKDGEWVSVDPVPNAFFVNIGDQIQVNSNTRKIYYSNPFSSVVFFKIMMHLRALKVIEIQCMTWMEFVHVMNTRINASSVFC